MKNLFYTSLLFFFSLIIFQSCLNDSTQTLAENTNLGQAERIHSKETTTTTKVSLPLKAFFEKGVRIENLLSKNKFGFEISPELLRVRKELEKSETIAAEHKKFIDAIITLEHLLDKGYMPSSPKVINLQIELIQLIGGIHPSQHQSSPTSSQKDMNLVARQNLYIPYIVQLNAIQYQIEKSSSINLSVKHKKDLISICATLIERCHENIQLDLGDQYVQEEKKFFEKKLRQLQEFQG